MYALKLSVCVPVFFLLLFNLFIHSFTKEALLQLLQLVVMEARRHHHKQHETPYHSITDYNGDRCRIYYISLGEKSAQHFFTIISSQFLFIIVIAIIFCFFGKTETEEQAESQEKNNNVE